MAFKSETDKVNEGDKKNYDSEWISRDKRFELSRPYSLSKDLFTRYCMGQRINYFSTLENYNLDGHVSSNDDSYSQVPKHSQSGKNRTESRWSCNVSVLASHVHQTSLATVRESVFWHLACAGLTIVYAYFIVKCCASAMLIQKDSLTKKKYYERRKWKKEK